MDTREIIRIDGEAIIKKLKAGQTLTSDEQKILQIYNSLYSGTAGNAGKRKNPNLGNKQRLN